MKTGEFIRFNDFCGIAKVINEFTNEEWYVVYAITMEPFDKELGKSIGKGKSKEEALIDAVKNIMLMKKNMEIDLEKFQDEVRYLLKKTMFTNNSEVILPIKGWEIHKIDDDHSEIRNTNEVCNADIIIDENNLAVEAVL